MCARNAEVFLGDGCYYSLEQWQHVIMNTTMKEMIEKT